jgi:hypothetical protein
MRKERAATDVLPRFLDLEIRRMVSAVGQNGQLPDPWVLA